MEEEKLSEKELQNKLTWLSCIITEFGEAYKKNKREAYVYIRDHGALDHIYKHWRPLHCENLRNVIRDMFDICKKNGGDW